MSKPKRDRYDQEIERVGKMMAIPGRPGLILAFGYGREHSPLFSSISKDRMNAKCGCPILIRQGDEKGAGSYEIAQAIWGDERLPSKFIELKAEHLPVLAEYQRRADKELGRTPPPMLPTPDSAERAEGA